MKVFLCALSLLASTVCFASPFDQLTLSMDRIFNQGQTSFCWAYSSYHTLRTYYFHASNDSAAFTKWKWVLTGLNDPDRFRQYLDAHFSDADNEPMTFTRGLMQNTEGGLSDDWTSYIPSERSEFTIPFDRSRVTAVSRSEIARAILSSLQRGAPAAFCGNGHCTSIYGATVENGQARTYRIADSVNDNGADGRSYDRDANDVLGILEIVMTLR